MRSSQRFSWTSALCGAFALALIVGGGRRADADDAAVQGVGGAMEAMREHPSVVMQSECVEARVSPAGADVHCIFIFRNQGPATDVKMGFPERGGGDIDVDHPQGFRSFRCWVDGKPAQTKIEGFRVERKGPTSWKRWRTKDVRFGTGQTRRVEVRYQDNMGEISDGSRFFVYQMRTGASWKGSIGRARVTADFAHMPGWSTSDGAIMDGRRIAREWRDFEPKQDFLVDFVPPAPPLVLNGHSLAYDLKTPPLPQMLCGELRVPANWFVRHIGGTLSWDPRAASATLRRGDTVVFLTTRTDRAGAEKGAEAKAVLVQLRHSRLVVSVPELVEVLGGSMQVRKNPTRVVVSLEPVAGERQEAQGSGGG